MGEATCDAGGAQRGALGSTVTCDGSGLCLAITTQFSSLPTWLQACFHVE